MSWSKRDELSEEAIDALAKALNEYAGDYTNQGRCTGCGECCGNLLPLSITEIARIKRYVKENGIKEQKHIVAPLAVQPIDFTCPFLDDTKPRNKCTIYKVRPEICRDFVCNKKLTPKNVNKNLLRIPRKTIDMRETFYGKA